MKRALLIGVVVFSAVAFAQAPAKAAPPAPAAPAAAKAAPVAAAAAPAAAAATTDADCDMHKAMGAMMKDVMASKAKVEMVKLDNGTTTIITADKKSAAGVEKAMTAMEAPMKAAMDGTAKLCDECKGVMAAVKGGKAMMGHGHQGMVWTMSSMTSDAEMVKKMHAQVDAKAAPPAKK